MMFGTSYRCNRSGRQLCWGFAREQSLDGIRSFRLLLCKKFIASLSVTSERPELGKV